MLDYYDYSKIMGRKGTYNFIIGARGLGKTYGAKKMCIRKAIRTGRKFIYLRRYKNELASQKTFFADIAHEFPGYDFRVNGKSLEWSKTPEGEEKAEWCEMGVMLALSQSSYIKSVSYAEYDTIIFDEFIIEKGSVHYIAQEPKRFNDFYSTVDRYNDRVKVFFLANAVSMTNPYFIEYGVRLRKGQEWYRLYNGFVVVHTPTSDTFAKQVSKTGFGTFVLQSDPEYAAYSIENVFSDMTDALIGKKPPDAKPVLTLVTPSGIMGVWRSLPLYYVTSKPAGEAPYFTTERSMVEEDVALLPFSSKMAQLLRERFESGMTRFQTPTLREKYLELYRR